MVDISPKDIAVLKYINHSDTVHRDKIIKKFGDSVKFRLACLENVKFIRSETTGIKNISTDIMVGFVHIYSGNISLTDEGKHALENYVSKSQLTLKEKWLERLIGFIAAAILAGLSALLSNLQ